MEKLLFESYKDYFRVGAAVSGFLLMSKEEIDALVDALQAGGDILDAYFN